jgi:hypothetical protein
MDPMAQPAAHEPSSSTTAVPTIAAPSLPVSRETLDPRAPEDRPIEPGCLFRVTIEPEAAGDPRGCVPWCKSWAVRWPREAAERSVELGLRRGSNLLVPTTGPRQARLASDQHRRVRSSPTRCARRRALSSHDRGRSRDKSRIEVQASAETQAALWPLAEDRPILSEIQFGKRFLMKNSHDRWPAPPDRPLS